MEFFKILVLLISILGLLRAQNSQNQTKTPLENAVSCVNRLVNPCTYIDQQCNKDYYKYNSCTSACSSNPTSIDSYQTCINACTSTNQSFAGYITQINNCIILATPSSSQITSFYTLILIILILIN
ncbi:hypothetical protein ABPG74_004090 [Tetrahymena malaccensis]